MGNNAQRAVLHFAGGRTYRFDAGTSIASGVTSMDADGFTVGNAVEANANGIAYHYVAFNDVANSIDVSSYAGNGHRQPSIATLGFQPEYALVRADDNATGRPACTTRPRWPATTRCCSPARRWAPTASRRSRPTGSRSAPPAT